MPELQTLFHDREGQLKFFREVVGSRRSVEEVKLLLLQNMRLVNLVVTLIIG